MCRNIFTILTAIVIAQVMVSPSPAITYGEADTENTYSNVGTMIIQLPDGNLMPFCSGTLIDSDVFLTAATVF